MTLITPNSYLNCNFDLSGNRNGGKNPIEQSDATVICSIRENHLYTWNDSLAA